MKKAYLRDLQTQLLGSVTDAADALEYFSTDGSIFKIMPTAVVYPKNTADVRKTVAFLHDRAEKGKKVGIVARGKGSDQSGGAVGDGIHIVFPAHMNRILEITKDTVTVQPGVIYQTLQQTLHTHGRFLPPYPSSIAFATLGGAVANNACGEKTVKYGATRDFVLGLKVVLADGSLIETKRISARELNRKKGQTDLEGKIYRDLDRLIDENEKIISKAAPGTSKNAAGYNLWDVKHKNGSFDLSQVIIGSQGSLGVVTEITFKTMPYNPKTTLLVGYFDSFDDVDKAVVKIQKLNPSAIEFVDIHLLQFLQKHRPEELRGLVPSELPQVIVLVEFDDSSQLQQRIKERRALNILSAHARELRMSTDAVEMESLWKIRRSAAAVIWMTEGKKKALPFIEDGVVPLRKFPMLIKETYRLLKKYDLEIALWGHAGDANVHLQPYLDLSKPKDVDKLYKLSDEFFKMVMVMGGSTCGEHNDGLIRAPYLEALYGKEIYELFRQVKSAFDPLNLLNPDKKIDVTQEYARQFVRDEYSMKHLYDHMPRT